MNPETAHIELNANFYNKLHATLDEYFLNKEYLLQYCKSAITGNELIESIKLSFKAC